MNYKELSKYDKLAFMQQMNFCRAERHTAAVYLNALRKDDRKKINYFESFGEDPDHIFLNVRTYERGLLFGFEQIKFNKYGWIESTHFLDKERFEFPHREGWAVSNYITIGRGENDKWTYGISISSNTAGSGNGISVWGDTFDSRKECLINALAKMTKAHQEQYAYKYSHVVLSLVKELFDTVTKKRVIQLSLFE